MDKIDLEVFKNDAADQCNKNNKFNVMNCSALSRLMATLKYFQVLNVNESKDDADIFEHFINEVYVPVKLVDDYTHLMEEHEEDIYDLNQWILSSLNNNKKCNIEKCQHTYRHYNDKNDNNKDQNNNSTTSCNPNLKFFFNLFDLMHFYLYHLYETGHRVKMDDIEIDDNEKDNTSNYHDVADKAFSRLKAQIMQRNQVTSSFTRFSRKTNTKYTMNVNDHEHDDGETFVDNLCDSILKMNAQKNHNYNNDIIELNNFIKENDYDSDALQEEFKIINDDNDGIICGHIQNEKFKQAIFKTLSYFLCFLFQIDSICFCLFDAYFCLFLFVAFVWRLFANIFSVFFCNGLGTYAAQLQAHPTFAVGYRFYYWEFYKDIKEIPNDEIQPQNIDDHLGYDICDLYVCPKYSSFKEELCNYDGDFKDQYENKIKTKVQYWLRSKKMKIQQKKMMNRNFYIRILDLLHYGHLEKNYHELALKFDNVLALVLYCDYSELCTRFSKSFRKQNVFETLTSVKSRNSKYFWFSKSLRETVELFGNNGYYKKEKDDILERGDDACGPFYCGMNQLMVMNSFCIRLSSPTSTSRQMSVAMKFGGDDGIIIQFKNDIDFVNEYLCGFRCTLSDYVEESETLFFGGFAPIHIESIRIKRTDENFKIYCAALFYLDSILCGSVVKIKKKSKEKNYDIILQILFYSRIGQNDISLPSLPEYIKQTINAFVNSKSQIILNLANIHDHVDKKVANLIMNYIVPNSELETTSNKNQDYYMSAKNLFQGWLSHVFTNVKTVTIITTNPKNNTSFEFSLFSLLTIMTGFNKVIIEAIVYDPFAAKYNNNKKATWISRLYESSVFAIIKTHFNEQKYSIEFTSARTVGLSQKHSFIIVNQTKQTTQTKVTNFLSNREDFYVTIHTQKKYHKLLLSEKDKFINTNTTNEYGLHVLHYAAKYAQIETIKSLIQQKIDINIKDDDGWNALHHAARYGRTETIKLLLNRGVDMNVKDNDGNTELHHAAWHGHTETVKLLLDRGVDMNVKNNNGCHALHFAAINGHTETVKLLLDRSVDMNVKDNNGCRALHFAAMNGHTETAKFLLDRGVDMNVKDNHGWHALHCAANNGHTETVKFLLDRGVDVNVKDNHGWHALHHAARNGQTEIVTLLLYRGVDINVKEDCGWHALHYAAANGHTETAKFLLDRGVDMNVKDNHGKTAIDIAEQNGRTETVKFLIDRGEENKDDE